MEARAFEANEALSEGIKIKWLSSIKEIGESNLTVEHMEMDANGNPKPTGQFETLPANSVVLALGQQADSGFLRNLAGVAFAADGSVIVDGAMMTGRPGVFAGGDVTLGDRTVTAAVGHGKKAARHIDAWLRGQTLQTAVKHPVVEFDLLNLPIYADAPRSVQRESLAEQRVGHGFEETAAGLSEVEAHYEARRCLSCGNCFECDQCYAACPEQAIIKLGPGLRYRYDFDRCTGCAVCYEQCPCHAIEMIPEPGRAASEQAV